MIQSHTLFTSEADSPEAAAEDIKKQLEEISLLRHSAGLVICHYDFVENGVVEALQSAVPFPLIGMTTFYQATPKVKGLFELTVTVLTSDDVRFTLGCSEPARENHALRPENELPRGKYIERVYREALAEAGENPSLILTFLSANRPVSGDEYLRLLDKNSGGIPCFGMVNSGEDDSGANIYILCGDRVFPNGFAILLLTGPVERNFYLADTPEERLLSMTAAVTEAGGTRVKKLNGQRAADYLTKNGVVLDENDRASVSTVPFYYRIAGEKKLVGRALQTFNGRGELEFLAEIPEKATLRVGTVTTADLLASSRDAVQRCLGENPGAAILLIGSCVGRFITLGLDTTSEMDYMAEQIPDGLNYLACYAGGEICPVQFREKQENIYHNNSFIICALR